MRKGFRSVYSVETLEKGMIHVQVGGAGHARFQHTTEKGAKFKVYGLFISGIFMYYFQNVVVHG